MKQFDEQGTKFKTYTFGFDGSHVRNYSNMTPTELAQEVDKRVQEYVSERPKTTYGQALLIILDKDPALKEAYAKAQ